MKKLKILTFVLFVFLSLATPAYAQLGSLIPFLRPPADRLPPVPTSDAQLREKEVGITIFGYTIPGLSMDRLTIILARRAMDRITDGTVDWINGGFNGSPQYMQDPLGTLASIGDDISGDIIGSIGANTLCSPFNYKVRLALTTNFTANRMPRQRLPVGQCTFTRAMGNIENFVQGDFNQGGWAGWVAVSQKTSNNPFGNMLDITATIRSDVSRQKEVDLAKASWGGGFLSTDDCTVVNGVPRCVTKTPGSIISTQLQKVLGSEVDQLNLTQDFDQIAGALFGQLSRRIFNSQGGGGLLRTTAGAPRGQGYAGSGSGTGVQSAISCFPSVSTVYLSDTPATTVTWSASVSAGFENPVYTWGGENIVQNPLNPEQASAVYTTVIPAEKSATLSITGTRLENGVVNTVTASTTCLERVTVNRYRAPTGICRAYNGYGVNPLQPITTAPLYNRVEFRLSDMSGGSGTIQAYNWDGPQNQILAQETLVPGVRDTPGSYPVSSSVFPRAWPYTPRAIPIPGFFPWVDGRVYTQWFYEPVSATMSVTIIDADQTVLPGVVQCSPVTIW